MQLYNPQTELSQLYWSCHYTIPRDQVEGSELHPFFYFIDYLEYCSKIPFGYRSDVERLEEFKMLKKVQIDSYTTFEYELLKLDKNKSKYINSIVAVLFDLQNEMPNLFKKKWFGGRHETRMLKVILKDTLKNIYLTYHLDLQAVHRAKLTRMYTPKESIYSFSFTKRQRHIDIIENKRLENLYDKYLKSKFIAHDTEFQTFRSLFDHRVLVNKINWIEDKSSLYYFIRLLITEEIIQNPKNKHWEIVSEFFLLKGENLLTSDLTNQKDTKNKIKRTNLSGFVSALKDPNS